MQLINSITEKWKFTIKQSDSDAKNLIIHGHHLMKGSKILILEKLTSKELYQILISSHANKVTSVACFETMFNVNNLHRTKIFILPGLTTYNTFLRSFQYKILYRLLFLRILTGKKHRQIKFQRLQKVQTWVFGLVVHQIKFL